MWNVFLYDTMTGLLAQQIDVPSFSWSMSVNDSSFTTTPQRQVGVDQLTGLQIPWAQIPARSAGDRLSDLAPYQRGIALFWVAPGESGMGVPVLAGALGTRSSDRQSVSLQYVSMMGLLSDRYLVHENQFGRARNHSSAGEWRFDSLSYRGLACEIVRACTSAKPGGELPFDLPYLGEGGTHGLPVSSSDVDDSNKGAAKHSTRRNTADGYVQTDVNGNTTTVTVSHTHTDTRKVVTDHEYSYWTKKHGKVTKHHETTKYIPTGRVTTTTVTRTVNKSDYAEQTVTTKTTTYTFDENGKQTSSNSSTTKPVTTKVPRVSESVYKDYNVGSHSCRQILDAIAASDNGPDLQFRPYLADNQHIRFRLLGGSDASIYLNQDRVLSLDSAPYGGTLENLHADWAAPYMRVYATGAGQGKSMICDLEQDLTLVQRGHDPWPLRETTISDSSALAWTTLASAARGRLQANSRPVAQFTGELHANDTDSMGNVLHPLGSFWPGEMFHVAIEGFPDWPDGTYNMRLMEMSGDQTDKVTLKFDPIIVPTESSKRTVFMGTQSVEESQGDKGKKVL